MSWQGNATNPSTIGHGLNQKPDVILLKNRDTSGTNWIMYHSANTSAPETDHLKLNSTGALECASRPPTYIGLWSSTLREFWATLNHFSSILEVILVKRK